MRLNAARIPISHGPALGPAAAPEIAEGLAASGSQQS